MNEGPGGNLVIRSRPPHTIGSGIQIEIDGHDISLMTKAVTLRWEQGEIAEAEITIRPDSIHIDAEVITHLIALAESEKLQKDAQP